jgi:RNA polymerase sigma-70 factor (sigma-E family)
MAGCVRLYGMMTVMSLPPGGQRPHDRLSVTQTGRFVGGGAGRDEGRGEGGGEGSTVSLTRSRVRSGRLRRAAVSSDRGVEDGTGGGDHTGPPAADPLADLHREHYTSLVRLATLVLGDVGLAEQITQDAFVKLQLKWGGLRRLDRAPAYLRSAVLNGARSHLRRRKVSDRHDERRTAVPAMVTPESAALGRAEHERVLAALRRLPERQREAIALRYYLDLPEAEIAAAMGVSTGSVKSHLHRGIASLAEHLREEDR